MNNKLTYTPGEYQIQAPTIRPSSVFVAVEVKDDPNHCWLGHFSGNSKQEMLANAVLFVNSPKMYRLLKSVLAWLMEAPDELMEQIADALGGECPASEIVKLLNGMEEQAKAKMEERR